MFNHTKSRKLTVALIAWDVGHNPLGRACILAKALSRYFHVILLDASFPRVGNQIWEPLSGRIDALPLPGSNFPALLDVFEKAAARIEADIILACKSRLPSIQLGLMMKRFKNRPLFIDIDDNELSFFKEKTPLTLSDIRETKKYKDLSVPYGETWTRFTESLLCHADGIFVSNHRLKERYGGTIIHYGRDERYFGSSLYAAIAERLYRKMLSVLDYPKPLARDALAFIQIQKDIPTINQIDQGRCTNGEIDIVMFWKQNDTGLYGRRSDMLMQYLSKRQKIRKVAVFDKPLLIEALRDKAKQNGINHDRLIYRETLLRNWGMRDSDKISFHTFIYQTGTKKDRNSRGWRFPDKSEYMAFIEDRLNELGIRPEDSVFWFYPENPYITKIVKQFKPKLKVVDLVDDHRTWLEKSEMKWFNLIKYYMKRLYLTNHYKAVLKTADLVFANCQNVIHSMQKYHHDIKLIPNGCELTPPPDCSRDSRFQWFESTRGPKLGYVGNLEKGKIDRDLIEYMAKRRPDWNIFLIGSAHANPDILDLNEYSNIHIVGVVQYPDVRAWIKAFDVAILPHLNSAKTQSMNPLKLYVYCSLEVPVVTTDIENLDELRSFVSIAEGYDDFIKKIELVLENRNRKISRSLNDCMLRNTWDVRVDQVLHEINAVL